MRALPHHAECTRAVRARPDELFAHADDHTRLASVTERDPPHRKVWETIGRPRLDVIGHYRMGFDIIPQSGGSLLCVFIDYAWPDTAPASWLGRLLGGTYARWCTRRMAEDAVARFSSRPELATR